MLLAVLENVVLSQHGSVVIRSDDGLTSCPMIDWSPYTPPDYCKVKHLKYSTSDAYDSRRDGMKLHS